MDLILVSIFLESCFPYIDIAQEPSEGLVKMQILIQYSGWDLRIYVSHKLSDDGEVTDH